MSLAWLVGRSANGSQTTSIRQMRWQALSLLMPAGGAFPCLVKDWWPAKLHDCAEQHWSVLFYLPGEDPYQ